MQGEAARVSSACLSLLLVIARFRGGEQKAESNEFPVRNGSAINVDPHRDGSEDLIPARDGVTRVGAGKESLRESPG